ncbi:MAG: histidine kinase [Coriobacteriales bacterium]|nr:histidine kinase [Coriobacteriales bacterium]
MSRRQLSIVEVVLIGVIVILVAIASITLSTGGHWLIIVICVVAVAFVAYVMVRYSIDPDRLRARQSERTLRLAAQTLTFMRQGLTTESAQEVCRLLLPATLANAVAITNREDIIGYAGAESDLHPVGSPILTKATLTTLQDARLRVITQQEAIGFPEGASSLQAAIIVPLVLHEQTVGVLKFYYRSAKKIDETQQAMAEGLGALLTMQLSLAELDYQRELASQMELKALQAQINPHFLFNTINTIASLIRTNPQQARILLREFAVFYRRTLEGSQDLITLEQEHLQTLRYLGFEIARFGGDRIQLTSYIEHGLEHILVPAFIIQPLVENAVGHGMRDNAPLHIEIRAQTQDGDVVVLVRDNGIGIAKDTLAHMLDPDREHLGIALKNVDDRLRGYFGRGAGLAVQSELGVGTVVRLTLGTFEKLKVEDDD